MGEWVKARYVAEQKEIAARYKEWEIICPREVRDVEPNARHFTPWKVVPPAELKRMEELPPEMQPHLAKPRAIDELEAFLATLFLRRYATYCAKRRPYSQMEGAARLHRRNGARRYGILHNAGAHAFAKCHHPRAPGDSELSARWVKPTAAWVRLLPA